MRSSKLLASPATTSVLAACLASSTAGAWELDRIDRLRWAAPAEAAAAARDCRLPVAVYLHSGFDRGALPEMLDALDDADFTLVPLGRDLPAIRVDLARPLDETARFVAPELLRDPPALLVLDPAGKLIERFAITRPDPTLWKRLEEAIGRAGKPASTYSDCRQEAARKKRVETALAAIAPQLAAVDAAIAARDWKRAWEHLFPLLEHPRADTLSEVFDRQRKLESIRAANAVRRRLVSPWAARARAEMESHRDEALHALRQRVPASAVPDDRVFLAFRESIRRTNVVAVGLWLGDHRAVLMLCGGLGDELATELPDNMEWLPGLPFHQLSPSNREAQAALSLVRREVRWDDKVVVPISIRRIGDGRFEVTYVDGWDGGCGHWSSGSVTVDVRRRTVTEGSHLL